MAQRAVDDARSAGRALLKLLSATDVGKSKTHQAGILLPKPVWQTFTDIPPIPGENANATVSVRWFDGSETSSQLHWYGSKNEYRLTTFGPDFAHVTPDDAGCLLVLVPFTMSRFHAYVVPSDDEIQHVFEALETERNFEWGGVFPKDNQQAAFRPRARLMLLLGDQLIRDSGLAVFELVKNAYDADATRCDVTLENISSEQGGRIVVEDDGVGMSANVVKLVWLEPGTDNRKEQRTQKIRTKSFRRLPIGEKGVGRFAVHKLGHRVEIVTRSISHSEVVVSIDWTAFENSKYLSDVPISIVEREPQYFVGDRSGTRIVVSELRDAPWTRGRVRSLHRSLTSICSPANLIKTAGSQAGDSFTPTLTVTPDSGWLKGLLDPTEALEHSLFLFRGTIAGDTLDFEYKFTPGTHLSHIQSRKASGSETMRASVYNDEKHRNEDRVVDLSNLGVGRIELQFHIFDLDPGVLRQVTTDIKGLKDFLKQNGGIRVYRDGIRVFDYGEPANDWLELGGRRVNLPAKRISSNLIIGFVCLDLESSGNLIEKTNREGFIENDAYVEFQRAISFAVHQAEFERNRDKDRIRIGFSKSQVREPVIEDIGLLRASVKNHDLESQLGPIIDRIESQFRDVRDNLLVAAGAGLNLSIVLHEVEKRIAQLLRSLQSSVNHAELLNQARLLSDMIDGLTWLTATPKQASIRSSILIQQAILNWKFRYAHHEIVVVNGLECGCTDFTIDCSRRMVTTSLMNLIDNSIYWLRTRNSGRKIFVGTTREISGRPGIVVADNGPGFQDPQEYLVRPFVTRKPDGMGLGLHIVDEVMKQHDGRLLFLEDGDIALPEEFKGAIVVMEFCER
jgi:signal transduction histidine kinase